MSYNFGTTSKQKLATCHTDLQKILNLAITRSRIDFGISEGYRTTTRQYQLFIEGKSKIDGKTKKGKHNYTPSQAIDIYVYHPDITTRRKLIYDTKHLAYIAGIITSCAIELYNKGEVSYHIRWGANWNRNGIIAYDQSFDDYPHFELVKP